MRQASFTALTIALLCSTLSATAATPVKHKPQATTKTTSHTTKATHTTAKHTTAHTTAHTAAHTKSTTHGKSASAKKSTTSHAPMDSARATEIQTALVKAGYLSGEPSGTWDAKSQAAIQKLQSDNGWQTKIVPDSRALIKLGLGPTPIEH